MEPGTILRFDLPANTLPVWQAGGRTLSGKRGPSAAGRTAGRASSAGLGRRVHEDLSRLLDQLATATFLRALAEAAELVESLPKPLAQVRPLVLLPRLPVTSRGGSGWFWTARFWSRRW